MPTEKVSVEWEVKLNELTAALQQAGGLTEGEAKKMVIGLDKQIQASKKAAIEAQKAAKAAQAAQKGLAKDANEYKQTLASVAKLTTTFGGSLGALGGTMNAAGSAAAELAGAGGLGGMAVAGGAATAAVAGLAYGIYEGAQAIDAYIDSADPLIDRLHEISGAKPISPALTAALNDYRQSSLGLEATTAQLHVTTAGFLAELAGPGLDALNGFALRIEHLVDDDGPGFVKWANDVQDSASTMIDVFSLGLVPLAQWATGLDSLEEEGHAAARGLEDTAAAAARAAKASHDAAIDMDLAQAQSEDDARRASAARGAAEIASKKAAAAETGHAKAIADATAAEKARTDGINEMLAAESAQRAGEVQLAAIQADAATDLLTDEQRIRAAYDERIAKVAEVADATGNLAAGEAAVAALEERAARDVAAARIQAMQATANENARLDAEQFAQDKALHEQQLAWIEEEAAKRSKVESEALDAGFRTTSGLLDMGQTLLQAKIDNAEGGSAAEKKAALRAWREQRALAIGSVILDSVAAYMGELSAFAELGPFAPAAAAAVVFPAEIASIATITQQSPPSFPAGGAVGGGLANDRLPDHVVIRAEPGEVVVDRATTRRNGGPNATLDRLRNGGNQPTQLINRYRHRDLSIVMVDHLRLDTPLARRIDRALPPGRRR